MKPPIYMYDIAQKTFGVWRWHRHTEGVQMTHSLLKQVLQAVIHSMYINNKRRCIENKSFYLWVVCHRYGAVGTLEGMLLEVLHRRCPLGAAFFSSFTSCQSPGHLLSRPWYPLVLALPRSNSRRFFSITDFKHRYLEISYFEKKSQLLSLIPMAGSWNQTVF